jgi:hypothetical protein
VQSPHVGGGGDQSKCYLTLSLSSSIAVYDQRVLTWQEWLKPI